MTAEGPEKEDAGPEKGDEGPEMPPSERELRRARRRKAEERATRRRARRSRNDGEAPGPEEEADAVKFNRFEVVAPEEVDTKGQDARDLIRRGLGRARKMDVAFEVVPREEGQGAQGIPEEEEGVGAGLRVCDDRLYDSDHEPWDPADRLTTLALGTLVSVRLGQRLSLTV